MRRKVDALRVEVNLKKITPEDELKLDEEVDSACQQGAQFGPPASEGDKHFFKIEGPTEIIQKLQNNICNLSGLKVEPFLESLPKSNLKTKKL